MSSPIVADLFDLAAVRVSKYDYDPRLGRAEVRFKVQSVKTRNCKHYSSVVAVTADMVSGASGSIAEAVTAAAWDDVYTNNAGAIAAFVEKQTKTPSANSSYVVASVTPPAWDTDPTLGDFQVGAAMHVQLRARLATAYKVSSGALPLGVGLDEVSGEITGTPDVAGPYSFAVDAVGASLRTRRAFSFVVADPPVWVTEAVPDATVGALVSVQLSATNAAHYSVASGLVPQGLSLSPTGLLSGVPTATGSFSLTVAASLSPPAGGSPNGPSPNGLSSDRTFAFGVGALPLWQTPSALDAAATDVAFVRKLAAASAVSYSVSAGSLPPGTALSPEGTVSGAPSVAGSYVFTVKATSAAASIFSTRAFSVRIETPPVWVTGPTLAPRATGAIAVQLTAGLAYSYATVGGRLPQGVALSPSGAIVGVANTPGDYAFVVRAFSPAPTIYVDRTFAVQIAAAPTWTTTAIADAALGAPMSTQLDATNAVVYSLATGRLPAGLVLNSGGLLSGEPTEDGAFTVSIKASSVTSVVFATRTFTFGVQEQPAFLTGTPLADAQVGVAQTRTFNVTNAAAFVLASGTLPPGMALSSAGAFYGTPSAAGAFSFVVKAISPAAGIFTTKSFAMVVAAKPVWSTPGTLQNAATGLPLSYALRASNAAKYVLVSGALPAGVGLSESGLLEGTPTAAGPCSFTVSAVSSGASVFTHRAFAIVVADTPEWTTAALDVATKDAPYSLQLEASSAVSYSVVSGVLPAGVSLSGGGSLTGPATSASDSSFVVRATSAAFNVYADRAFTMIVAAKPAWTTEPALAGVARNEPVSVQLVAADAVAYAASGALPPGLALSGSGVLSGTPTTAAATSFALRATSTATSVYTDQTFSMLVVPRPAWVTPPQLADVVLGAPQSTQLTASAATAYVVQGGPPTAGCTLTDAGLLSGTTNSEAVFSFVVRATTQSPDVYADRTFTQAVAAHPIWASGADVDVPVGEAMSTQLAATDAASYAVIAGSLPQGLVLTAGGLLRGTASVSGVFPVTVRATSIAASLYADKAFAVRSAVVPTWTTAPTVPATVLGTAMPTIRMAASPAVVSYTVVSGALPTGVTLTVAGELSGAPATPGTASFTVRAATSVPTVFADRAFTFAVFKTPAFVSPASRLDARQRGVPMSVQLVAVDASTFAVASGALPPGIALSSAGVLSGTPTASGETSFTVRAGTPAATIYADRTFQLVVATRPTWVTTTLAAIDTALTTRLQLAADGAAAYSVAAGALPVGLSLSSTGVVSGTAEDVGAFTFTVRAAGTSDAIFADKEFDVLVGTTPEWVTPAGLTDVLVDATVSVQLEATYAAGYALITTRPPGLELDASGLLSWSPTQVGSASFTVRAASAVPAFHSDRAFTLRAARVPTWESTTLPDAQKGVATSLQLSASGAAMYSVASGTVPPGLTVSSIGALSGTPTADGPYAFTVRASSLPTIFVDRAFALLVETIPAWVTDPELPDVAKDEPFEMQLAADDVDSYHCVPETLPAGVSMTSGGHVAGTPTAAGAWSFTVRAESTSSSMSVERTFTLMVAVRPTWTTPPVIPPAVPTVPWTFQLDAAAADGGFELVSASAPLSANVREDIEFFGLLVVPYPLIGVRTFVARAYGSSDSIYADREFTVTFGALPDWTTPEPLVLSFGAGVALQLRASGAVTFAVESGVLPPGTSLSPAGLLSGVPTAKGPFAFEVLAVGAHPTFHASRTFTAVVESEPEWVTASPLAVERGLYASVPLLATDAASYSVVSGAAPAGMTVGPTGLLEGTPTAEGPADVTVRASSASGEKSRDVTFAVTVTVRPTWVTPATLPDATTDVAYSEFLVATDGEAYAPMDELPDGLSLSAAGVLSGAPTTPGSYSFTVLATCDLSATRQFNLTVA